MNRFFTMALSIPIPLSDITKRRRFGLGLSGSTVSLTPPSNVYLRALDKNLFRIYLILFLSLFMVMLAESELRSTSS